LWKFWQHPVVVVNSNSSNTSPDFTTQNEYAFILERSMVDTSMVYETWDLCDGLGECATCLAPIVPANWLPGAITTKDVHPRNKYPPGAEVEFWAVCKLTHQESSTNCLNHLFQKDQACLYSWENGIISGGILSDDQNHLLSMVQDAQVALSLPQTNGSKIVRVANPFDEESSLMDRILLITIPLNTLYWVWICARKAIYEKTSHCY
jgi:hypothetical protein